MANVCTTEDCYERPAPTIVVPEDPPVDPGTPLTKQDILNILGYQEVTLSKEDADGTTTVVVPGVASHVGG